MTMSSKVLGNDVKALVYADARPQGAVGRFAKFRPTTLVERNRMRMNGGLHDERM